MNNYERNISRKHIFKNETNGEKYYCAAALELFKQDKLNWKTVSLIAYWALSAPMGKLNCGLPLIPLPTSEA